MASLDPRDARASRMRGWLYIVWVFLFFMLAGLFASRRGHGVDPSSPSLQSNWFSLSSTWLSLTRSGSSDAFDGHPITKLMAQAEQNFKDKLSRQSKTLAEAVAEYKRRYGRSPPRGFDEWWTFAKLNDVKLIDEYDAIVEDLAPFWSMSSEIMRQRVHEAGQLPSIDLVRIENGEAIHVEIPRKWKDPEKGHRSLGFRRLMERYQHKLPNMDIPVNARAEGRVLVPWEYQQYSNITIRDTLEDFTPDWLGTGNVWEAYRRTCEPYAPARRLFSSYRNPHSEQPKRFLDAPDIVSDDFTFVENVETELDYCQWPWAHFTQGHFFSDWRTMSVLYPIMSPARAQGFSDIRIPSHYYLGKSSRYTYGYDPNNPEPKDIDDMEVPWDEKSDLIFWRGATTGGGSTPNGFSPNYQRHRFVRMTHENSVANYTIIHESPVKPGTYISTTVPAAKLNQDIMDVAFVNVVGSYPGGEAALRATHRFADSVPLGRHWSYKYLIDLDGMGYSGRFMALMASDSAVIKSTVYREFFSDWIEPWLHFIPLSSSYSEIYNIHAYFSGPSDATLEAANMTNASEVAAIRAKADAQLKKIARAGKQWKKSMARIVDMEAYVYRLVLEYARLWAEDRDAWNFEL
ncbi:hypothetical protein ID866_2916 [Astraeus odoratus]|nr:hypothetical protein ID866_2916 [Astraeus odoratus]